MVTRRSVAATGDNECPMLKLIMEKGPLSGKTSEFLPGTCIHIGRIARGNTLAIKDAGISSKHLLIQVEMVSNDGQLQWTITDLGSSNGTILNGAQLEESKPALLSDDDIIKIGEKTSIRVKLEVNGNEDKVSSIGVRRNMRGGRSAVGDMEPIDEKTELELEDKYVVNSLGPRILENNKPEDLGSEVERMDAVKGKGRGRKARGFVAKELNNKDEVECLEKVSTRRTRSSKMEENLVEVDGNKKSDLGQRRKASLVETRSSKEQIKEDLGLNEEKGGQRVRTRNSKKIETISETVIDLNNLDGKKTKKGRGRPKKLPEEKIGNVEKQNEDLGPIEVQRRCPGMRLRGTRGQKAGENICETEIGFNNVEGKRSSKLSKAITLQDDENDKRESEIEVKELVEEVNPVREEAGGLASTSGANDVEKMVVDLDKITMGEWLDFLDSFLPKQITDETEEMISEMRKKSERLHKFMLQQKDG